jgi:hypothetical protein
MRISHAFASSLGVLVTLVLAAGGCSGSDDDGSATGPSEANFAATAEPLPGFSYDTGLVPASSPAQVQLKLTAAGAIKVDAVGTKKDGKIVPRPGSGKLTLDIHVKSEGKLKLDTALKKYDGDLPGLKNVDIPITGEVAFDPFLLADGEKAAVTADIPETKLPPIPLGTVPGELVLTVVKGSTLTTTYQGKCVSVAGGKARYSGQASTQGKLVIKGQLAPKLPPPLDKPIDLPVFEVAVPPTPTALDSAAVDMSGLGDKKTGACR